MGNKSYCLGFLNSYQKLCCYLSFPAADFSVCKAQISSLFSKFKIKSFSSECLHKSTCLFQVTPFSRNTAILVSLPPKISTAFSQTLLVFSVCRWICGPLVYAVVFNRVCSWELPEELLRLLLSWLACSPIKQYLEVDLGGRSFWRLPGDCSMKPKVRTAGFFFFSPLYFRTNSE